ncbi:hypothetical protein A946_06460 [Methylacidiphilum kamchatkense Kam1]|uniref:DUF1318 domain-containing protein n=1 Tax=Methylacidiphilum kamchatkense Kam1 TaxID=1202785 RepID=A0A0C1RU57_9BACT|nr:DUF1318 domain-containing protein [Methylacidiphilum kamchatkense]KIE58526.1 hypothetical protein A946_06460 [Methylacidiphilum kamchatkense Kam1]QDQ43344.1 putative protein DUF1318 [Methylacidiphilum kamchatkense Kam1]
MGSESEYRAKVLWIGVFFVFLLIVNGCRSVRISPKQPKLYDVNASVNVKSPPIQQPFYSYHSIQERRRMRMGEIQALKNNRMIGEGKDGYLHIVKSTEDEEYRNYIQKIVDEENRDRQILYNLEAKKSGKEISQIEKEYGQKWQSRAFKGEMIEEEDGWKTKTEDFF